MLNFKRLKPSQIDPIGLAREALDFCKIANKAEEVYLFGSAATGDMGPHSDIDLLVVLKDLDQLKKCHEAVLRNPFQKWPIDWVFKTMEDFIRRSEVGGVCYIAKHQGKRLL